MTRREMLRECRDGAVRHLPRLLGSAAGLWTGLEKLLDEQDGARELDRPTCFPTGDTTGTGTPKSVDTGE